MLPLYITLEMTVVLFLAFLLVLAAGGILIGIIGFLKSIEGGARQETQSKSALQAVAFTARQFFTRARQVFNSDVFRLANNPIVIKELRETVATKRAMVIFAIFTGVMALTVWMAWPRGTARIENIDLISQRLFTVMGTAMLTMICLLAPAHSATAITGEKERDCFDLLVTSGITPLQIMIGKLVSALVFIALLVIGTAPMMSVCLLLGGTSPGELFALFLLLFDAMVIFSLIGLTCSCIFQRNNAALGVTYIVSLPLLCIVLLMRDLIFTVGACLVLTTLTAGITAFALNALAMTVQRPPEIRDEEDEGNSDEGIGLALKLDRSLIPDRWLAPPRRTELLSDGANPVLDKEISSEIVGQGTLMLRVILQAGCALTLLPFTILFLLGQPAWYFAYLMVFTMLIAPSFTSGMLTGERENGTFELLVTTLISPGMIIWAKVVAGLRLVCTMLLIMTLPTLPGIIIGYSNFNSDVSLGHLIGSGMLCLLWAFALVVISLMWSMISRRTTSALIASYITGMALLIGPNLLHLAIRGFTNLEAPWLESVLLISPLTHLFTLTPGTISSGLVPLGLTSVPSMAYGVGLLVFSAALMTLMIWGFERTWRHWVGFSEA